MPHDLPVFQHEGGLVAAHFQHPARPRSPGAAVAKAGVEKAGIMHPEFARHRQIGCHFRSVVRRDRHRFAADQNIECAGVQDDAPLAAAHLFPVIARLIGRDPVKVDHAGMRLGPVAHQIALPRHKVHRKAQSVRDHRSAIHQRIAGMQRLQVGIRQGRLTAAEPDLVQPLAGAHQHRKAARADFGI